VPPSKTDCVATSNLAGHTVVVTLVNEGARMRSWTTFERVAEPPFGTGYPTSNLREPAVGIEEGGSALGYQTFGIRYRTLRSPGRKLWEGQASRLHSESKRRPSGTKASASETNARLSGRQRQLAATARLVGDTRA
jgi:hypothetical protein